MLSFADFLLFIFQYSALNRTGVLTINLKDKYVQLVFTFVIPEIARKV